MTDPRLIRIIVAQNEHGKYVCDIMDCRNGSKLNVVHYDNYKQLKAGIEKDLDKWRTK